MKTCKFELLNVDFKGPLPSTSKNRLPPYNCEWWFPFPICFFVCVLWLDCQLKTAFYHIWNSCFYLFKLLLIIYITRIKGIFYFTTRTAPWNPQHNGQTEHYNGIVWKTIEIVLKTKGLVITSQFSSYCRFAEYPISLVHWHEHYSSRQNV